MLRNIEYCSCVLYIVLYYTGYSDIVINCGIAAYYTGHSDIVIKCDIAVYYTGHSKIVI